MHKEANTGRARRSGEQTKWAATFLVASELVRRGWQVGLTHGNTETADILASHPESGRKISVDVKGIHAPGHWFGEGLLGQKRTRPDHHMVFVALPDPPGAARIYIIPGRTAVQMAEANRARASTWAKPVPSLWEKPPKGHPDFESLQRFRDAWGLLRGPQSG